MTARTIAALAFIGAIGVLVFIAAGRRSRRFDGRDGHRDGYREGVQAEAARWEAVTGVPFGRLQAWRTGRGPDPFANLAAETEVLPDTGTLLAAADAALGKPTGIHKFPGQLTEQEAEQWKARWEAAQDRAPVVADITSAAIRWRPPGMDEIPVVTGRVVSGSDRNSDDLMDAGGAWHGPNAWDRAAALPAYAAKALGGHRTVDELVDSIVMRAVNGGR